MQIDIPQDQYEKLTEYAVASGYSDVSALLAALASAPAEDFRWQLSEEEMSRRVAECEDGIAEIKAGRGRDFRQAMIESGRKRGFPLPE